MSPEPPELAGFYVDSVASRALSVLARRVFPAVSEKCDAWKYPFDDVPQKVNIAAAHRPAPSCGTASARLIDSLAKMREKVQI